MAISNVKNKKAEKYTGVLRTTMTCLLALTSFFIAGSCSGSGRPSPEIVYVGSTPGGPEIKASLGIPGSEAVDFIRWTLLFKSDKSNQHRFVLAIVYGEGQPNTRGFKGGGQKLNFEGSYTISPGNRQSAAMVYQLEGKDPVLRIRLVKLDDNLLHFLTSDNNLMVGTSGWSYTLCRKEPIPTHSTLPGLTQPAQPFSDTSTQLIFGGRTPCLPYPAQYLIRQSPECLKIKWKLILNRDPGTLQPTTYEIMSTNNRDKNITGRWMVIRGIPSNPDAVIYRLEPIGDGKPFLFFAGDPNVIYFITEDMKFLVGDEDFSFTLNKAGKY